MLSRPLGLTDAQIDIIQRAAKPLPPRDRSAFLQTIAELLSGQELGDGVVARAAAAAQRRHRDPPDLSDAAD
jgi:DNA-directed RNA polymerase specialized sigma24 family protein